MSDGPVWQGEIRVRRATPAGADRLLRALLPEASREVPRARAVVDRPDPDTVRIRLTARDTGAARAAVNTYLGWISLAERTERAGRRPDPDPAPAP